MSDVNFYGVLQMPFELAMSDELSRRQFYSVVQEAVKRLHTLEQPADKKPQYCGTGHCSCIECIYEPRTAEQEPVAWYWDNNHRDKIPYVGVERGNPKMDDIFGTPIPLYTHPAPPCQECGNLKHDLEGYMEANKALINREWQGNKEFVGLSDDEIHNLMIGKNGVYYNFARAIEQALKEKNNG